MNTNNNEQDILPIFFIFSEDRVLSIDVKKFKCLIKKKSTMFIFQINSGNFSQNIDELHQLDPNQIEKVQMVKDFKLTKWETGEEDVFTLFVIETKR